MRGSKGCIILLNMILGWWIQNCRHLLLNNNSCFRQKFRVNTQQLQEIIFTCWKISMMVRLGITTVVAPAFFPRSPTAGFLFIWTIHILPALRTGNILKFCGFPNCQKIYEIRFKTYFFIENGEETDNKYWQINCKEYISLQVQTFQIIFLFSGPGIQKEDGGSWPSFVLFSMLIDVL